MEPEDLEPVRKPTAPGDLDQMGVEDLEAYLADLKSEIERVEAKLAAKRDYLSSAQSLFKT